MRSLMLSAMLLIRSSTSSPPPVPARAAPAEPPASTPTTTAAAVAAATATAFGLGPRFVYREGTAFDFLAVHGGDRRLGLLITAHLDEAEAFRAPRVTIHD